MFFKHGIFHRFYPKSVRTHKSFKMYKTMYMPEPAENVLYKTQLVE